jgi:hypothetical protein
LGQSLLFLLFSFFRGGLPPYWSFTLINAYHVNSPSFVPGLPVCYLWPYCSWPFSCLLRISSGLLWVSPLAFSFCYPLVVGEATSLSRSETDASVGVTFSLSFSPLFSLPPSVCLQWAFSFFFSILGFFISKTQRPGFEA